MHKHRSHERPDRDHVVDLQLRSEVEPEERRRSRAVRRDALLAAEQTGQHERRRIDELAHAERDQREDRARPSGRYRPEQDAEQQARRRPGERNERHGNRQSVIDRLHHVNRDVAAEPEVHGMAEGQEAGLSQQHVERKREDRGDAHLAQHRVPEVRVEARHVRQHDEDAGGDDPRPVAPRLPVPRRDGRRHRGEHAACLHASRVPRRPRGRTTSISTSSR